MWQKIIVAGESQGSGMALLLSQHCEVARVLQFAGVDDVVADKLVPAPWVSRQGWLTPLEQIYGLGNANGMACQAWQELNWPATGMIGIVTQVDGGVAHTVAPHAVLFCQCAWS